MSQLTEKTAGTGAGSNADRSEAESEKSVTTEKIKVPTVAKPKMRLDENGKIVIDKMSLYQTFQNERKVLTNSEILDFFCLLQVRETVKVLLLSQRKLSKIMTKDLMQSILFHSVDVDLESDPKTGQLKSRIVFMKRSQLLEMTFKRYRRHFRNDHWRK